MKKILLMLVLLVFCFGNVFSQEVLPPKYYGSDFTIGNLDPRTYGGYQWERIDLSDKAHLIGGLIAGIDIVRIFTFDLNLNVNVMYGEFDKFIDKDKAIESIIKVLDKWYEITRNTHRYDTKVDMLVLAIYSKYWWKDLE